MAATRVQKQDILSSKSTRYLVLDMYGEGGFGIVAKCLDLRTYQTTAIKIHKSSEENVIQEEVDMLNKLRVLDSDKNNLVRFIEHFMFKDLSCIAFEMLDRSLWDLVGRKRTPLSFNEIRPITQQLLVAFKALKGVGIIHSDLKLDNVMLVNHQDEPFRVKLIDFGLAIQASEVGLGMTMQPVAYRAPEVILGLPISEAIDMWGLGCLLAHLYFGIALFPGESTYQTMEVICQLLGQPEDHLLDAGGYTWQYFSRECLPNPGWRFNTKTEYTEATGVQPKYSNWYFRTHRSLEDIMCDQGYNDWFEFQDGLQFLDLLKQLLSLNAETRITPEQALKHPFVTMVHLEQDRDSSSYAEAAFHLMNICSVSDSDEMEANRPSNHYYPPHMTEHSNYDDEASQVNCNDLQLPIHRSPFVKEPYWNSSANASNTERSNYDGEVAQMDCNDFQLPLQRSPFVKEPYWNASSSDKGDANSSFQVQKNDILSGNFARYLVLDFNGEGCFGKVAKCVNLKTFETTAIKIHKESGDELIQSEVDMLKQLRTLDPEKKNVVKFIDNFMFQGLSCLAFEILDRSLWDLMEQTDRTLPINQIRPITQQLLVAFEALKGVGILHTDLKPDNVMLVNHQDEPFRVKLIDFGLAIPATKVELGMTMQAVAYRAPEVTLGLPISEAIDMWGLGCVMAFLYFGNNLFPGTSPHDMMNAVCQLLGQPPDHLLSAGKNTYKYFRRVRDSTNPGWRLKTPVPRMGFFGTVKNLDEAVESFLEKHDDVEYGDRMAFLDLLKRLLDPNPETRITPSQALQHTFITMVHLEEEMGTNSHAKAAFELMTVCPLDNLAEFDDYETDMKSTRPAIGGAKVGEGLDELDDLDVQRPVGAHAKVYSDGECVAGKANWEHFVTQFIVPNAWPESTSSSYRVTDHPSSDCDPCCAVAMVDMGLTDLVKQRQAPLSLIGIRPITHQLLVALEALKGKGVIHTDLNPDSIRLVNPQDQPTRIKLTNFRNSLPASEVEVGMVLQQCAYRAPEVNLALPVSEAIDMWGLGCVIAYLFFGFTLFPGESSYYMMKSVCHMLGQPEDHLLSAGENTCMYFIREQGSINPGWRLKTREEFTEATGAQLKIPDYLFCDYVANLDDAIERFPEECDNVGYRDRMAFLHLLKQLLDPNPQRRITPRQALNHCFITMAHLEDDMGTSLYAQTAKNEMRVSPLDDSDGLEEFWSLR